MTLGKGSGTVDEFGGYPYRVCSNGVGINSIMCTSCSKLVHRQYSGVKGCLQALFVCKRTHRILQ